MELYSVSAELEEHLANPKRNPLKEDKNLLWWRQKRLLLDLFKISACWQISVKLSTADSGIKPFSEVLHTPIFIASLLPSNISLGDPAHDRNGILSSHLCVQLKLTTADSGNNAFDEVIHTPLAIATFYTMEQNKTVFLLILMAKGIPSIHLCAH